MDESQGAPRALGWVGGVSTSIGAILTAITGIENLPALSNWTELSLLALAVTAIAAGAVATAHFLTASSYRWLATGKPAPVPRGARTGAQLTSLQARLEAARKGVDLRRGLTCVILSGLTAFAALAGVWITATDDQPDRIIRSTSDAWQPDHAPIAVRVIFLNEDPSVASSDGGCTPAQVDYAFMVGGSFAQPVLRFVKDFGPQTTSAFVRLPKRDGPCDERSWLWKANGPDLVLLEEVG